MRLFEKTIIRDTLILADDRSDCRTRALQKRYPALSPISAQRAPPISNRWRGEHRLETDGFQLDQTTADQPMHSPKTWTHTSSAGNLVIAPILPERSEILSL